VTGQPRSGEWSNPSFLQKQAEKEDLRHRSRLGFDRRPHTSVFAREAILRVVVQLELNACYYHRGFSPVISDGIGEGNRFKRFPVCVVPNAPR